MNALANIASHNAELAGVIISCEAVSKVLMHLCHYSVFVQRQAARLVQEITKHSLEVCVFFDHTKSLIQHSTLTF